MDERKSVEENRSSLAEKGRGRKGVGGGKAWSVYVKERPSLSKRKEQEAPRIHPKKLQQPGGRGEVHSTNRETI